MNKDCFLKICAKIVFDGIINGRIPEENYIDGGAEIYIYFNRDISLGSITVCGLYFEYENDDENSEYSDSYIYKCDWGDGTECPIGVSESIQLLDAESRGWFDDAIRMDECSIDEIYRIFKELYDISGCAFVNSNNMLIM